MRPGQRRALDKGKPLDALLSQLERTKASIRARVEHRPSSAQATVWVREGALPWLKKGIVQIVTLFALANPWMARHKLLACTGQVRVQGA
jgi:IS5 family transposase